MAKYTYPPTSPYWQTPQSNFAIGRYVHRRIAPDEGDKLLPIDPKYHLRPDLMASDLYGDSGLYWVFMARNLNVIRDPLWEHEAGKKIWVPSKNRIGQLTKR